MSNDWKDKYAAFQYYPTEFIDTVVGGATKEIQHATPDASAAVTVAVGVDKPKSKSGEDKPVADNEDDGWSSSSPESNHSLRQRFRMTIRRRRLPLSVDIAKWNKMTKALDERLVTWLTTAAACTAINDIADENEIFGDEDKETRRVHKNFDILYHDFDRNKMLSEAGFTKEEIELAPIMYEERCAAEMEVELKGLPGRALEMCAGKQEEGKRVLQKSSKTC